jgi:hypothetical protein
MTAPLGRRHLSAVRLIHRFATTVDEARRFQRCMGSVRPNVGAKGEASGGTPGPDGRQCTPYLPAGPGGTPLDLPLSEWLGGTRCENPSRAALASPGTCWPKPLSLCLWSLRLKQPHLLIPYAGAKGDSSGVTPGPEDRKCTPYLTSGPGGTPLLLPLERPVRLHLVAKNSSGSTKTVLTEPDKKVFRR